MSQLIERAGSDLTLVFATIDEVHKLLIMSNPAREEIMMHYVKYTMDAFWHLMQTFSTLSFDRRLSLLVPDERFREDFQRLLDLELQKEFPHRRFQLVTCEELLIWCQVSS